MLHQRLVHLRVQLVKSLIPLVFAAVLAGSGAAHAQQCLPLLNQLTKPLIQSALKAGQGKVCQKVPRYTQTRSLNVAAIKVCPEGEAIVISGIIDVT